MILRILVWYLCCLPLVAPAQPVPVISGEHAGFSRLVVLFDTAYDWEFGRVPGGYELRTDARSAKLFDRGIYDFIPRSRITSVTFPGPGRMFLAVLCTCSADVFDIKQGRLAIDIKDGVANENSRFEGQLSEMVSGVAWQRLATPADDVIPAAPESGPDPDYAGDIVALLQKNFPSIPLPPSADDDVIQNIAISGQQSKSMKPGLPETGPGDLPAQSQRSVQSVPDRRRKMPDPVASDPDVNATASNGSAAADMVENNDPSYVMGPHPGGPILSSWPRDWGPVLPELGRAGSEGVELAQTALLEQLSRAAAQGLIQLDLPETPMSFTDETSFDNSRPETAEILMKSMSQAGQKASEPVVHLRIETVMDRDANRPEDFVATTDQGQDCLADDLVQVADWGPADGSAASLSGLRANILKEFDTPDPMVISELVNRYLYLGFGAEVKNLIRSFPVQLDGADILLQMADIVDHGNSSRPGRLASQLTCSTPAAMWAVLVKPEIPRGVDIDTNHVIQTFAGLPAHLRRLLGPGLVGRFLVADNPEIAASIRDITDRATEESDAGFQMMQAQIANYEGDINSAQAALRDVVATGSPEAPLAMVALLESVLANGGAIDNRTALLADALATENRGTDVGRRLTLAAIRAYAVSGQIDVTFDRITQSVEDGFITTDQAEFLAAEAHMQNAMTSSDAEFLRALYMNPLAPNSAFSGQLGLVRVVAARLLELGLPKAAIQAYGSEFATLDIADQQILARADLASGDTESAYQRMQNLTDPASLLIRARINEMRQNFTGAAKLYKTLNMDEYQESVAWRAGDWPAIAQLGAAPRAQFAELILASFPADPASGSDAGAALNSGAENPTLATSKSLLAESQLIRELVDALLEPSGE